MINKERLVDSHPRSHSYTSQSWYPLHRRAHPDELGWSPQKPALHRPALEASKMVMGWQLALDSAVGLRIGSQMQGVWGSNPRLGGLRVPPLQAGVLDVPDAPPVRDGARRCRDDRELPREQARGRRRDGPDVGAFSRSHGHRSQVLGGHLDRAPAGWIGGGAAAAGGGHGVRPRDGREEAPDQRAAGARCAGPRGGVALSAHAPAFAPGRGSHHTLAAARCVAPEPWLDEAGRHWGNTVALHEFEHLRCATANVNTLLPGEWRQECTKKTGGHTSRMVFLEAAFARHDLHAVGVQETRIQTDATVRCGSFTIFSAAATDDDGTVEFYG